MFMTSTIGAVGLTLTLGSAAQAGTLLLVDLSNVDEITITATNETSSATLSGSDRTGIYLTGIFGANQTTSFVYGGNLVIGDLSPDQNTPDGSPGIFVSTATPGVGLNIWSMTDDPTLEFVSGQIAFQGSGTWIIDSAAYTNLLAGPSSGQIVAFADDDADIPGATAFGTWQKAAAVAVVPLPAPMLMLGGGLLALGAMRAQRRRS